MELNQQQRLNFLYDTFLEASKETDKRLTGATEAELVEQMEAWDNGNFAAAVVKVAQRHAVAAARPTRQNLMRRLFRD